MRSGKFFMKFKYYDISINFSCSNPMPEISSRTFIEQADLLDSAFVPPLIQLLLSLFNIDRLPELLGFNLGMINSLHFSLDLCLSYILCRF